MLAGICLQTFRIKSSSIIFQCQEQCCNMVAWGSSTGCTSALSTKYIASFLAKTCKYLACWIHFEGWVMVTMNNKQFSFHRTMSRHILNISTCRRIKSFKRPKRSHWVLVKSLAQRFNQVNIQVNKMKLFQALKTFAPPRDVSEWRWIRQLAGGILGEDNNWLGSELLSALIFPMLDRARSLSTMTCFFCTQLNLALNSIVGVLSWPTVKASMVVRIFDFISSNIVSPRRSQLAKVKGWLESEKSNVDVHADFSSLW